MALEQAASAGMSAEAWAAWAQALLSGLAIVLAVLMPWRQARDEQRRKLKLHARLLERVKDLCENAASGLELGANVHQPSGFHDHVPEASWLRLAGILDEVPRYEVPDPEMIPLLDHGSELIHDARTAMKRVRTNAQNIQAEAIAMRQRVVDAVKIHDHAVLLADIHDRGSVIALIRKALRRAPRSGKT